MSNSNNIDHFINDPGLLIDVFRDVINRLDASADDPEIGEKEAQLREISRTIDRLDKAGVAIPDVLRAEKTRLASALGIKADGLKALNLLADKLEGLLKDLKVRLHRGGSFKEPRMLREKRSRSPKTDMNVLREYIILALKKLGGRARTADILAEMERQLSGKLLPGDLETSKDGIRINWQLSTKWARVRMIQDGTLRSDSPRGYWELNEDQK